MEHQQNARVTVGRLRWPDYWSHLLPLGVEKLVSRSYVLKIPGEAQARGVPSACVSQNSRRRFGPDKLLL